MTPSTDRIVYQTDVVTIGAFRCGRDHDSFEDSGPIANDCFVFPRTAVVIEHDHERPFVANPNVVNFYNRGDRYRRAPIADEGDRCDWFALRHDVALDIVGHAATGADEAEHPFPMTHALSDARTYARQRRIFGTVSRQSAPESLAVEESVIWLLDCVVRSAWRQQHRCAAPATRRQVDLVHDAKQLLSREFTRDLTLGELARRLDVSVFHLCHVFQRLTGCTLHEYRHQLRLRWSLERLETGPPRSLVHCALDAGFSSHSHYGAAFRKAFGMTPSAFADANR